MDIFIIWWYKDDEYIVYSSLSLVVRHPFHEVNDNYLVIQSLDDNHDFSTTHSLRINHSPGQALISNIKCLPSVSFPSIHIILIWMILISI
jgi:hypothetical protein